MLSELMIVKAAALIVAAGTPQTVTVSLDSSRNGQVVSPGEAIDWTISFAVSTEGNAGLALLLVDLEQEVGNPVSFDLLPADGVPVEMANFSRPDGVCHAGESGSPTGYVGLQRGTVGAMNLRQIGGGQNNAGEALPAGSGIAENANVVPGIGQSGEVVLATGSFTAPQTAGVYSISMTNVLASVFSVVNAPPEASPVVTATTDTNGDSITYTVAGTAIPAVSGWGMVIMTLTVICAGTCVYLRRHRLSAVMAETGAGSGLA